MNYSPAAAELIKQLDDPSKWDVDTYTIYHKPSRTHWWISNGASFFDAYGNMPSCIGILERHFLWPKVKKMINERAAQRLSSPDAASSEGSK